jgi:hypothetical protein
MQTSVKGTIDTILSQVETTKIDIGHIKGHFISEAQIIAIRNSIGSKQLDEQLYEQLTIEEKAIVDEEEATLRTERRSIQLEIGRLTTEAKFLTGKDAARVNEKIGSLLSRRAKIDKHLRKY